MPSSPDCLFCKIAAGIVPASVVYEDETMVAFRDIHPQAPTHILVIPRAHLASLNEVTRENAGSLASILSKIPSIAAREGLTNGYRVISNVGPDACQSVQHLHFHILGGRPMADKMA